MQEFTIETKGAARETKCKKNKNPKRKPLPAFAIKLARQIRFAKKIATVCKAIVKI